MSHVTHTVSMGNKTHFETTPVEVYQTGWSRNSDESSNFLLSVIVLLHTTFPFFPLMYVYVQFCPIYSSFISFFPSVMFLFLVYIPSLYPLFFLPRIPLSPFLLSPWSLRTQYVYQEAKVNYIYCILCEQTRSLHHVCAYVVLSEYTYSIILSVFTE
jgi:hypothetical protein